MKVLSSILIFLIVLMYPLTFAGIKVGTQIGAGTGSRIGNSTPISTRPSSLLDSYYDETCNSWTHNSTTPTLPAGDATCALVTPFAVGITAAAISDETGFRPAWSITYRYAGTYRACWTVSLYSTTINTIIYARIQDVTNYAALGVLAMSEPAVAGIAVSPTTCAFVIVAADNTTIEYDIQLANGASTTVVNIGQNGTPATGTRIVTMQVDELGAVYVP